MAGGFYASRAVPVDAHDIELTPARSLTFSAARPGISVAGAHLPFFSSVTNNSAPPELAVYVPAAVQIPADVHEAR